MNQKSVLFLIISERNWKAMFLLKVLFLDNLNFNFFIFSFTYFKFVLIIFLKIRRKYAIKFILLNKKCDLEIGDICLCLTFHEEPLKKLE